jgi:hypothetical protein
MAWSFEAGPEITVSELSLDLLQRDPTGLPDRVERAAVSETTLSNETLPAWRNVRGRLSPGRFPLPPVHARLTT